MLVEKYQQKSNHEGYHQQMIVSKVNENQATTDKFGKDDQRGMDKWAG